jgi:hypothetical protein
MEIRPMPSCAGLRYAELPYRFYRRQLHGGRRASGSLAAVW